MNKLYFLFCYDSYYPAGGMGDLYVMGAGVEAFRRAFKQRCRDDMEWYDAPSRRDHEDFRVYNAATLEEAEDIEYVENMLDAWRSEVIAEYQLARAEKELEELRAKVEAARQN